MDSRWRDFLERSCRAEGFGHRDGSLWDGIAFTDGIAPQPTTMADAVEFLTKHVNIDRADLEELALDFAAPPTPEEDFVVVQVPRSEPERARSFVYLICRASVVLGDEEAAKLLRLEGIRNIAAREEATAVLRVLFEVFAAVEGLGERLAAALDHMRTNYRSLVLDGRPVAALGTGTFSPTPRGPLDALLAGKHDRGLADAGNRAEEYVQLMIRVLARVTGAVQSGDGTHLSEAIVQDVTATVSVGELERWCFPEAKSSALHHLLTAAFFCESELRRRRCHRIVEACRTIEEAEGSDDWFSALTNEDGTYWSYFVGVTRAWGTHLDDAVDQVRALLRERWFSTSYAYFSKMLSAYQESGVEVPPSFFDALHELAIRLPEPEDAPDPEEDTMRPDENVGTPITQNMAAEILGVLTPSRHPAGDVLRKRINKAEGDSDDALFPLRQGGPGRNAQGKLLKEWVQYVATCVNESRS